MNCGCTEAVALVQPERAIAGFAEFGRLRQHGAEHRIKSYQANWLMTLSTSAVAVCCCRILRSSLSSRVFSIAMTACAAKFLTRLDLLVGERPHLLAIDDDGADQLVVFEHRHANVRSSPSQSAELADRVRRCMLRSIVWTSSCLRHAVDGDAAAGQKPLTLSR